MPLTPMGFRPMTPSTCRSTVNTTQNTPLSLQANAVAARHTASCNWPNYCKTCCRAASRSRYPPQPRRRGQIYEGLWLGCCHMPPPHPATPHVHNWPLPKSTPHSQHQPWALQCHVCWQFVPQPFVVADFVMWRASDQVQVSPPGRWWLAMPPWLCCGAQPVRRS